MITTLPANGVENRPHGIDDRHVVRSSVRRDRMKHDTIERATTMRLEQAIAGGHGAATAASGTHRPRRGRVVSEAIVSPFVAGLDAVTIFAAGVVAMRWGPSGVDWRLEGIVILLGALLGMSFLHLAGAHRFAQFADLGGAIGRAL